MRGHAGLPGRQQIGRSGRAACSRALAGGALSVLRLGVRAKYSRGRSEFSRCGRFSWDPARVPGCWAWQAGWGWARDGSRQARSRLRRRS
jgi:hypothetical protein